MTVRPAHSLTILAAAIALFVMLGWIGGTTFAPDVATLRATGQWREVHPQAVGWLILYTHLGSAASLLIMMAAGALWLWWRGERRRATALLVAVLGARIGIEILKLLVDRPRPGLDAHPVLVYSQSFPSGHAGNSMATFLSLALLLPAERWRKPAVLAAVSASLAMGSTRPLLGVHWPSDVLAGWLYGTTAALLAWSWVRKRGARSGA